MNKENGILALLVRREKQTKVMIDTVFQMPKSVAERSRPGRLGMGAFGGEALKGCHVCVEYWRSV